MRHLYRRLFSITLFTLAGVPLALAGGAGDASGSAAATTVEGGLEAPILAAMVADGTLPPLAERLPEEPLVVEPFDEVGRHGGTWRRTYAGSADTPVYTRISAEDVLRKSPAGTEVIPNVARAWDVHADGQGITLFLRRGMKWSDGEAFTSEDVMFWYEDWALNDELRPQAPRWMLVNGEPGVFTAVDDYTVRITFSGPYGLLLRVLAEPSGSDRGPQQMAAPAHYARQFHPDHAGEAAVDAKVKEAGLDSWVDLFNNNAYGDEANFRNPDLPVITAWRTTTGAPAQRVIAERNPYYWKVDPAGQQLPYFDRVVHDQVENPELVALRATNGEIDMQFRALKFTDFTLLKENEAIGDYTVLAWPGDRGSDVALFPNLTAADPVERELFNNLEFKRALSLAINRDEINELFYFGLGTPRQVTAIRGEPTFEADVANQYIDYDPAEANRILDRIGFAQKDSDGIRIGPDGEPISFLMPWATRWPQFGDVGQVVCDNWRQVGVGCELKPTERADWYAKSRANELGMTLFTSPGTSFSNNWWMFPQIGFHNSPMYGKWYNSGGTEGEAPPADVKRAMDLFDSLKAEADPDRQVQMVTEILRLNVENLWSIGIVGEIPAIGVVRNNVGNVPRELPNGTHLNSPRNANPEQFYFKS